MLHRSFGEIPKPGQLEATDDDLLAEVERAFDSVGDLIRTHRQRQAIAEAMRVVGEVNKYVTEQAPYKLKDESQRERLATILYVVAQAVSDCNLLLSPFLPFSANTVDAALGGTGQVAPMPRIDEVDDLDGGPPYPVITGDYSNPVSWERHPVTPGVPVKKPSPIFVKLDPSIVDDELARLGLDGQS
jgi:methionyl-tRNA synthetase